MVLKHQLLFLKIWSNYESIVKTLQNAIGLSISLLPSHENRNFKNSILSKSEKPYQMKF